MHWLVLEKLPPANAENSLYDHYEEEGPTVGLIIPLDVDEAVFGRSPIAMRSSFPGATFMYLASQHINKCHARLRRRDGGFVIEDLRSRNGTYVNGAPIKVVQLVDGDRIRLADWEFVYRADTPKAMNPDVARNAEIRPLDRSEHDDWLRLREQLWPDVPRTQLANEQLEILADPKRYGVFVAALPGLVAFVEVSIRDWAEGCMTRPVGYLEGWYVAPEHRQSGIGRRLIQAAESWAQQRGCTEMGSDADLWNQVSHAAHRSLGYVEVGRSVLFSKRLDL